MGIALSHFEDDAALPARGHKTPALWQGQLGWAPPAGFVDFTLVLNRITAPLRPDRRRIAAGAGSHTEDTLIRCIDTLGLSQPEARLDMSAVAAYLIDGKAPQALSAIVDLSALGLLDLCASVPLRERGVSLLQRRLNLPLSPSRPTLMHVLAHAGQECDETEGVALQARFALLQNASARLDAPSHFGRTPLHIAVLSKNLPALRALIALGAKLEARDARHDTALAMALRGQFEAGAKILLAAGAQPQQNPRTRPPRLAAQALSHPPVEQWADLLAPSDDMTALMFAAAAGHTPTLLALIEAGADVNLATGELQQTALHVAARADQPLSIETLIAHGADPDVRDLHGLTPLHLAAMLGKAQATRALMSLGADLNAVGRCGRRPFDLADAAGHRSTLEALMQPAPALKVPRGEHTPV